MDFKEKLISLRRAKGFSQEQLADLINVSRQAVSKWETAESQPDLAKLILLSHVFEVSLDELCGRASETAAVQSIAPTKNRSKLVWLLAVAIIFSFVIGLTGGIFASNIIFPATTRPDINSVSITSLTINGNDKKIHLVFCPSVANTAGNNDEDKYSYKVLKIDSDGKTSSYPAVFTDGVCISDVTLDYLQRDFTLNAVISDGTCDYMVGLVKIIDLTESGIGYESLWNN